MSQLVNWSNPYEQRNGRWMKGNLHTHTSPASGCGTVPLQRVLDLYVEAGHDFLAISDHMVCTPVSDPRIIAIPGVEWNSSTGHHTGIYGAPVPASPGFCTMASHDELLNATAAADGLSILNHPNWQYRPHYHREELLNAGPYEGVEIFNGVIKRLEGYEISTDKWDYLLAHGRRVLGIASDDSHAESDIGLGWIMVRCDGDRWEDVLAAIRSGNLYCSTGITITDIRREGDIVEIETEDAQEIQIVGEGGRLLRTVHDRSVRFDLNTTHWSYVRFTAFGQGSSMAWTQPFFVR